MLYFLLFIFCLFPIFATEAHILSFLLVVDGDDLTSYDFEENVREQDAEDEKSWYQLEWELASHDGRITGMNSCITLNQFIQ